MRKRWIRFLVFGLLVVLQLTILSWLVAKGVFSSRHSILRLDTSLSDPVDLMRGRYLSLAYSFDNLVANDFAGQQDRLSSVRKGDTVYLVFSDKGGSRDTLEYASLVKPDGSSKFMKAMVTGIWTHGDSPEYRIEVPVKRYYIREDLAIAADRLLRDETIYELYVEAGVDYSGDTFIIAFYVNGTKVENYIEAMLAEKTND